jgi:RND superfamily putative drug exporter
MAMFLTPALTALMGHAAWWPGHADEAADRTDDAVRPGTPVPATAPSGTP